MSLWRPALLVGITVGLPLVVALALVPRKGDIYLLERPASPTQFHAVVTAYSSSPDETWGDPLVTASGRLVFNGLIACPRRFTFGTKFRIDQRIYTCWNRLSRQFDHRFDIWMSTKEEALLFGRRRLLVEML